MSKISKPDLSAGAMLSFQTIKPLTSGLLAFVGLLLGCDFALFLDWRLKLAAIPARRDNC